MAMIVILVSNMRCIVGVLANDRFLTAENWEELEPEAERSVRQQGGALNLSGIYLCPAKLAKKAVFARPLLQD